MKGADIYDPFGTRGAQDGGPACNKTHVNALPDCSDITNRTSGTIGLDERGVKHREAR